MAFCNAREIGLRFVHFEGNLPSIHILSNIMDRICMQIKFDSIFKTLDMYVFTSLNMYAILPLFYDVEVDSDIGGVA
jgi:hypothetical protein